ncbi:AAA family ATPase [Mesorhizobium sp. B2-8-9]|uniref:AAA family ATPase n=1 Tax=Mesorhizobium sp. B2-8-9 TaxID=2589899 RepID=UPI00112669C0|nr:AAA family ATPase [Mesorhizobium sp. B2-8-9]TPI77691.1 ATP-binding protein [Mesorhizobium sp. B2-8-9]
MSNPIDEAHARLVSLLPDFRAAIEAGQNESDTRLKILDRFLFEVLNWKHEAVFTEPLSGTGYIDYLLTIGGRNETILEAKRVGLLSPTTKGREVINVALSGAVVKPLLPGIRQAMGYAMEKGVAVAAVTDGNTWLFFRGSRTDGKPPMEGKGILFPDIDAVANNFAKFADLLSPASITNRHHLAHLNEAEGITIPEAEQQFFVLDPNSARMRRRDPLATDAALLFAQFFSRMSNEKDREMLRDCFVETGESRKADVELEKIIQRVLNTITPLETGKGGALVDELSRAMETRVSETVLIVGNKGAGKSTFIDRFFEQVLPSGLRKKCVVCRIDLEDFHGDRDAVARWAMQQLLQSLEAAVCSTNPPTYDELQGIFFSEYQRWSQGTRKNLYETNKKQFKDEFGKHIEARREAYPDEYVRLLLAWSAKSHQQLPCLVFDNTDQFSPEIQDAVYQLAHSLESAASVFNVVPITDRTVWRLSKAGALQSYSAHSFYLPVPDAKEIISRRVNFLQAKVEAEPGAAKSYFSRLGFRVEINDLAILADAVRRVFVDNDYVSGFIGRLGNFDIRRMLRIAERIFLSPELAIDEIIKSRFGGEDVTTDKNKTHRALIRGEYDRFNEIENEFISNIFSTNPLRPAPPLLAYYILWLLRQKMNSVRPDDDNVEDWHWRVGDLCRLFEGCGVQEELVLAVINRLYERRLVEALDPNTGRVGVGDQVAIKESGIAHLELTLNSSVYLEQMALATGVAEVSTRDEMQTAFKAGKFRDLQDAFLRYILKVDRGRLGIPPNRLYEHIEMARKQIQGLADSPHKRPPPARKPRPQPMST